MFTSFLPYIHFRRQKSKKNIFNFCRIFKKIVQNYILIPLFIIYQPCEPFAVLVSVLVDVLKQLMKGCATGFAQITPEVGVRLYPWSSHCAND